MAIYSWGWRICFFLAWRSGDAAGQRPLFSIFMTTYFLVWIQRGFVSISLCSEMWSYFRLEFLSLPFIAHHLVLQCVFHLGFWFKRKKTTGSSFSSQQLFTLHGGSSVLLLQPGPNDWTVLLDMSHRTLLISSVKFCSPGSRVGGKGPAQSSLATPCITRMQMSYEAIHLLEMPPWFQFESCLQSHCVSPLLHVKEVSLCERSEGDNCT